MNLFKYSKLFSKICLFCINISLFILLNFFPYFFIFEICFDNDWTKPIKFKYSTFWLFLLLLWNEMRAFKAFRNIFMYLLLYRKSIIVKKKIIDFYRSCTNKQLYTTIRQHFTINKYDCFTNALRTLELEIVSIYACRNHTRVYSYRRAEKCNSGKTHILIRHT